MKFRKKPVIIDAWPFTGTGHSFTVQDDIVFTTFTVYRDEKGPFLNIETLEGNHRADPGDWIIRGVKGEFYPCKADIFAMTYEPAGPNKTV